MTTNTNVNTNEKASNNEKRSEARKERFEFKLTMNGYIVCQRYFRINGFKKEVYSSFELVQALDNCVEIIKKDMRDKSHLFLEYTAPQVLRDEEEMLAWYAKHKEDAEHPDYILLQDSGEVYQIREDGLVHYEKNFNKADYLDDPENHQPAVLKLSFLDNGKEMVSVAWDASYFPRFIRTNVDVSNSRNRYRNDGVFAPLEMGMIDRFNNTFEDLIPKIVTELYDTCTYENVEDYTKVLSYGPKTYNLDIAAANKKYMRKVESDWKKAHKN